MRYFDHNATHPLSPVARQAWIEATERWPANPSSPHRLGDRAAYAVSTARAQFATCLGCSPESLIWTSGATESANTAFAHLAQEREGILYLSAIEHPCVRESVRRYFPGRFREIGVDATGRIDLSLLEQALDSGSQTAAVALMAANNETGVLQPWREVLGMCRTRGLPFLCDAAQWVGKLPAAGLGECDYVMGCGHKFGGPMGIGFLKAPANLRPLLVGGPQEDGRRAGTENVPAIVAMVAALRDREGMNPRRELLDRFLARLDRELPEVRLVGDPSQRLWNTASLLMPELPDCRHRWVVKLDKLGFAVSTGSACASGKEQPSHVLTAMGFSPAEASRAIRISAGWESTAEDWDALFDALMAATAELTESPAVVG